MLHAAMWWKFILLARKDWDMKQMSALNISFVFAGENEI